jgi:alanine racemase
MCGGVLRHYATDSYSHAQIEHILIDSRKVIYPESSLFVAIKGERNDGHRYLKQVYDSGVRNFLVQQFVADVLPEDVNIIQVNDSMQALQLLAKTHRMKYALPVVGITGSNGKTTVKEWLYHILSDDLNVVRSPKSYNSQVGVPLSLWQINVQHQLAIIEAGVSQKGEMPKLQEMIQPRVGIFTCLGTAHDEGFHSRKEKIFDKLQLFKSCELLVISSDQPEVAEAVKVFSQHHPTLKLQTWSSTQQVADIQFEVLGYTGGTSIKAKRGAQWLSIRIPFTDAASVQNACTCFAFLIAINRISTDILKRFETLHPIEMRLQLKEGVNGSVIVSDTYNSDLSSLRIALDFLQQQATGKVHMLIISDVLQSGLTDQQLCSELAALLKHYRIQECIAIGKQWGALSQMTGAKVYTYRTTDDLLLHINKHDFHQKAILIKGARLFQLERVSALLERKVHETVFEINLNALVHNLNVYRKYVKPETKIMAMVKAFSYGAGSYEIARVLEFHRVDYLTVAYADEGVVLREAGVKLPIMVMNPERSSFDVIISHALEPEVYNFEVLQQLIQACKGEEIAIHLEFDTGMKRLGFTEAELDKLLNVLAQNPYLRVKSVFTHMVASEDKKHDEFTLSQIQKFKQIQKRIKDELTYPVLAHAMNSGGIVRFPDAHFDMVRLGIGLYGIDPSNHLKKQLQQIGTLKSVISQISELDAHETVGYNRKGVVMRKSKIATVAIGYADGYNRKLGNRKGYMIINGQRAPVIGSICMDMTMLDVTDINCKVGDEVIVIGEGVDIQILADKTGTIPYEILTSISQRVKRTYFQE